MSYHGEVIQTFINPRNDQQGIGDFEKEVVLLSFDVTQVEDLGGVHENIAKVMELGVILYNKIVFTNRMIKPLL